MPLPAPRSAATDFYALLGLDRGCTTVQVRAAYRILAKRHHPDLHQHSDEAEARQAELNAAHETLSDPARRRAYDEELQMHEDTASGSGFGAAETAPSSSSKSKRNVSQDVQLNIEDFLRGTRLIVRLTDPTNPNGPEAYTLIVPPGTAPGERFRVPRAEPFAGGTIIVRAKVKPSARFKAKGSDLRCDLRISAQRATNGGQEILTGPSGQLVRVQVPAGIARDDIIRVAGEGLPKARGGRGDLLIRVRYTPTVTVERE